MKIAAYSPSDLGYRRVGPLPPWGGGRDAAGVASFLANHGYEVNSSCWIRRPARRSRVACAPLIEIVTYFDRESRLDDSATEFVDRHFDSPFKTFQPKYSGDFDDLLRFRNASNQGEERFVTFSRIGKALSFAGPNRMRPLFRDHVAPWFFANYPDGRIAVLRYDMELFRISSAVRATYTMAKNSFEDLKQLQVDNFPTLRQWQNDNLTSMAASLIELTNLIWYPFIASYQCGPLGLTFVFLLDPPEEHRLERFPRDWLALSTAHGEFAGEDVDDSTILTDIKGHAAWRYGHRRYRSTAPPPAIARFDFLRWYVSKLDRFFYELTDLANFTASNDPAQDVDPVITFEHLLTIARTVRRTLAQITQEGIAARKVAAFEIADIYGTLFKLFGAGREDDFFKRLFDPSRGPILIGPRLAALPSPVGDQLRDRMTSLYAELETIILDSIWLPSKRTATGILVRSVKDPQREVIETGPEFVANALRAYRNAHHGYFTRADAQMRPSRYLYLLNGNVPDSIGALPMLWLLAYLADTTMVGWQPLPIGAFD